MYQPINFKKNNQIQRSLGSESHRPDERLPAQTR